ncbi:hypothetical protein ABC733_14510 [Mangrovibacter sp. SLW1]
MFYGEGLPVRAYPCTTGPHRGMLADRLAAYAPAFAPARLPTGWHRLEGAILTPGKPVLKPGARRE